jgi:hypothetical protein
MNVYRNKRKSINTMFFFCVCPSKLKICIHNVFSEVFDLRSKILMFSCEVVTEIDRSKRKFTWFDNFVKLSNIKFNYNRVICFRVDSRVRWITLYVTSAEHELTLIFQPRFKLTQKHAKFLANISHIYEQRKG